MKNKRDSLFRTLSVVCASSMLLAALPTGNVSASVRELVVHGYDALVLGAESTIRLDAGDAGLNGPQTVTLSGYLNAVPEDYVSDGLVLRLDGLQGTDEEAGTWTNLANPDQQILINPAAETQEEEPLPASETDEPAESVSDSPSDGSDSLPTDSESLPADASGALPETADSAAPMDGETEQADPLPETGSENASVFTGQGLQLNGGKVFLPEEAAAAINSGEYTVEYFVSDEGYSGYDRAFSPILTVEESADTWSIFTRTPGQTMELKQGSSPRMQTGFENAVGVPSAITASFSEQESVWYADGQQMAEAQFTGKAAAEEVILGGRGGGESYETEAEIYSVRIYDRVLTEEELKDNAALDRSRFLGETPEAPELSVNGTALEDDGETEVEVTFENGQADLSVLSNELGSQSLTITVNGQEETVELTTLSVVDAAAAEAPGELTLTLPAAAADADICMAAADALYTALADTVFLQQGGVIRVTGSEGDGFRAEFSLSGQSAAKELALTVNRGEPSETDALTPYFQTVLKGCFQFDSAEEITADSIEAQVREMLADETVTPAAEWDESRSCWMLTLTQNGVSAQMPLYLNSEAEFTFDDPALMNYVTTRMAETDTAYIAGGALHVSGATGMTYENVVLPVWNYGRDFCIEATLRMTSAANDSRWLAVSYGVRPNSAGLSDQYTFRQMAVRQNATASNGVEFAQMTDGENPGWNVTHTASYSEALDPGKTYTYTIIYRDGTIYEYINEQLLIKAEDVPAEQVNGKVALSFDRLTAEMTDLRVTSQIPDLPTEIPMTQNGYDAQIYEPETGLVMAPTVVSTGGESAAETASSARRPATLVRELGPELTVSDNGEEISILDYMARLDKKALAGFRIEDMETAKAFAAYAAENELVDINIISSDGEVLKAACNGAPGIRGMLDFTGGMPDELIDVVFETNRSNSRVAIIPASAATKENIAYIQARAVTVWVQCGASEAEEVIFSGADGILTDDPEAVLDVIESFDPSEKVLTRNTVVVAHRGFHETAPENSERAAMLAVEAGADAIECDVYMSSDGYIMINHDDTTGRLMNQNLNVSQTTKDVLQSLTFTVGTAQEGDKMPTLEELFAAADEADPDDDIIHVIELKSTDPAMIEPMAEVIYGCGMEDRVVFISFSDAQIQKIREVMPEISVGELNSATNSGLDNAANLKSLSDRIDPLGAFYNCAQGAQTAELVAAARHRGIFVHPWTVNGQSAFEQEYYDGYHGITSDRVDYATGYLTAVQTEQSAYTIPAGQENATEIPASLLSRGGETPAESLSFRQTGGNVRVQRDENGRFWAAEAGTAVIRLAASYTLPATGVSYTVYSDPISLTFTQTGSEDAGETNPPYFPTRPSGGDETTDPDTPAAEQPDILTQYSSRDGKGLWTQYADRSWSFLTGEAAATGWQLIDGTWYYFQDNGGMATGWQLIGGTWYYLQSWGGMATGWQQIGGAWYYLQSWGGMATGWQQIGGAWYYLQSWGGMATGWQQIDGSWYYFQSWGGMAADTTIDGYCLGADGAML